MTLLCCHIPRCEHSSQESPVCMAHYVVQGADARALDYRPGSSYAGSLFDSHVSGTLHTPNVYSVLLVFVPGPYIR